MIFTVYDASSGHQPGFLTGNIQDIGSYDECVEIIQKDDVSFQGQFCKIILNDTASPLQNHISLKDIPISYALCVPSTCSAQNIKDILNTGGKKMKPSLMFAVDTQNCLFKTERPFNMGDWAAMLVKHFIFIIFFTSNFDSGLFLFFVFFDANVFIKEIFC